MKQIDEITIEVTNYCPNDCKFCSSNSVNNLTDAKFISVEIVKKILNRKKFNHIILSGGEPLSHPMFWYIYLECKKHTDDVVIYSNAITHLIYNPHIIDGVYLEANLTVTPETDKIHILKRVKQGRELNRPEVYLSRNHTEDCNCNHIIYKWDGKTYCHPCNKYKEAE